LTLLLLLLNVSFILAAGNRFVPIILIHGINNVPRDWDIFTATIKAARPSLSTGRLIELHSPFDGVPGSWVALNDQVSWFARQIRFLIEVSPKEFKDGFDLVCHSQGAVICRSLIQDADDLRVRSFVSLAGPQMGVYGEGFLPPNLFPPELRSFTVQNAWEIAYQKWAQIALSPANLWHDPYHETEFLERNVFLPPSLGLVGTEAERTRRKNNFLRLDKAVFLVGNFSHTTYELGIDPWVSGIFGYYDKKGKIKEVWDQSFFIEDTFGLRTLHETGRLVLKAVPDVLHDDWIYDHYVIRHHVLPYLTPSKVMSEEYPEVQVTKS